MTKIPRKAFDRYLNEASEALQEAKSIVYGLDREAFIRDMKARYALRYSIILLVEALADLAMAILEKDFNTLPHSYREAFLLLAEKGVISIDTARKMEDLTALRNMIVHRYWTVDDDRIYTEARESGLGVVERFIREVMSYADSKDP